MKKRGDTVIVDRRTVVKNEEVDRNTAVNLEEEEYTSCAILNPPPFPEKLLDKIPKIPPPVISGAEIPKKCPPPPKIVEEPRKPSIKRPYVEIIPGVIPPAPIIYLPPPLPENIE